MGLEIGEQELCFLELEFFFSEFYGKITVEYCINHPKNNYSSFISFSAFYIIASSSVSSGNHSFSMHAWQIHMSRPEASEIFLYRIHLVLALHTECALTAIR